MWAMHVVHPHLSARDDFGFQIKKIDYGVAGAGAKTRAPSPPSPHLLLKGHAANPQPIARQ